MKTMNIKKSASAFAVIGTAALLSAFSFGTSAQAASYATTCQTLSGVLGPCCNRMMGSQVINVYGDCHTKKRIAIKRKVRVPPVVVVRLLPLESEREGGGGGGGNGGEDKGRGPKSLR